MKISVCAKGGSGKSTIVMLLANEARNRNNRVLIVDSDESNSGLYKMLGFEKPPTPLMELVGGKASLKKNMGKPGIFAADKILVDEIPPGYLLQHDNIMLVSIGKILQSLEGCACPMGVLSREFLKKIVVNDGEMVIVDMEAGVEHFGRGVETSIDNVLIVVEPPFESTEVATKIYGMSRGSGIKNTWAVLNKIPNEEIKKRLKKELDTRGIEVIGCVYLDHEIFMASVDGRVPKQGAAANEIKGVMDFILTKKGERRSN
ncbi:MAG: AAA family ATPase [Deltaproteobacteria bacterium]|nr:AAA family ATPase [Deltaproteobacteria bacterium]